MLKNYLKRNHILYSFLNLPFKFEPSLQPIFSAPCSTSLNFLLEYLAFFFYHTIPFPSIPYISLLWFNIHQQTLYFPNIQYLSLPCLNFYWLTWHFLPYCMFLPYHNHICCSVSIPFTMIPLFFAILYSHSLFFTNRHYISFSTIPSFFSYYTFPVFSTPPWMSHIMLQ